MTSRIVSVESSERLESRRSPLTTWLQLANFATLSLLSLLLFRLYKAVVRTLTWITAAPPCLDHIKTILFLGPKNELNLHLLQELSHKFSTPVQSVQGDGVIDGGGERVLLYAEDCSGSRDNVLSLHTSLTSTYGPVDLLIVSDQHAQQAPADFLASLNRQLLTQFWIVTAFLPGMMTRNRGSIMSIAMDRSTSLANAEGVMRTIYEDVVQKRSGVTLTLVEGNSWIDALLPALPAFIRARLVVSHLGVSQIVFLPSAFEYLCVAPVLLGRIYLKPLLDFWWQSRSRTPRLTNIR